MENTNTAQPITMVINPGYQVERIPGRDGGFAIYSFRTRTTVRLWSWGYEDCAIAECRELNRLDAMAGSMAVAPMAVAS